MKKFLAVFALLSLLQATAWSAPAKTATPDPSANPVFARLQSLSAKFYYMGNSNGLDGWFIVQNGQVQVAYATADNKGAIIGALFGPNGENVTALQVANLVQTNKEVAALIAQAQTEQAAIAGAAPAGGTTPVVGGLPAASLSPGERLMQDLQNASTVIIGKTASPEILMVMDVRCPHCQATWKAMRDSVARGNLHLRLIPIGNPDSEDERAGAILLNAADPQNAWDKYIGGDASALAGQPTDAALAGMRANHALIDNWKITQTPYLVYRAADGKVKVVIGEPKVPVMLKDLGLQ